jgi:hypothetical protein
VQNLEEKKFWKNNENYMSKMEGKILGWKRKLKKWKLLKIK